MMALEKRVKNFFHLKPGRKFQTQTKINMDYKSHFKILLDYNLDANILVADTLEKNSINSGKPIELLSHIINAEIIILERIRKTKNQDLFEMRNAAENKARAKSIHSDWLKYLTSLQEKDFNNTVDYVNIRGQKVTAEIWDMFMHLINHSNYHRAQIATQLRSININPPITDFINFRMNKKNNSE